MRPAGATRPTGGPELRVVGRVTCERVIAYAKSHNRSVQEALTEIIRAGIDSLATSKAKP